jgi:hypothetical protein
MSQHQDGVIEREARLGTEESHREHPSDPFGIQGGRAGALREVEVQKTQGVQRGKAQHRVYMAADLEDWQVFPWMRNYTASFTYTVYKHLCPNDGTWKDKSQRQKQGEG